MRKKSRTNDNLIPFHRSRHVIRLEPRGRQNRRFPVGASLLTLLSAVCFLYCVSIFLFWGYGTRFFLIWGVLGCFFGGLAFLGFRPDLTAKIPSWIRRSFQILCALALILFLSIEGLILGSFCAKADPGADYVIILGAQWKQSGPSYVLQKRLLTAVDYLRENPDARVIVSGGQGSNEPISEADGMAAYLENAGIEPERILRENRSRNTVENLTFSSAFLDKKEDKVVLVTNNYHVYRAVRLARKQGYEQVFGLAAPGYPSMAPNNLLREFLALIKEFLCGNL